MPEQKIQWELTDKQAIAWDYLNDSSTTELLFGGGAGGGKSFLLCGYSVYMCLSYNEIRGFIGRNSLEDFKKSTLLTLYDVIRMWNLKEKQDFTHNQQDKYFHFKRTGSRLYYNELSYYPSDPNYDYLGSTEYTFACVDEASQVREKAKAVLKSRIRYKLQENNLVPKLFGTCNPDKSWIYSQFYRPNKQGTLPVFRRFVQALAVDNRFIDSSYIDTLKSLDLISKERLLYGNWEYDADPSTMCEYDAIVDLFTNTLKQENTKKYLVVDVARFGSDKTVFMYFNGFDVKRVTAFVKQGTDVTAKKIIEWCELYQIPRSQCLVDEDGIGGGVKDQVSGIKGFIANTSPFKGENFNNLKSQCGYALAKKINAREIHITTENEQIKEWIKEELEQLKAKDIDKDGKKAIVPKDMMKEKLGRSPDFLDCLLMRFYFEYQARPNIVWI